MQRVIPPDRVKPAFDKVNASIQEKQKLENEAESERNKLLPEARASRDKLIREAEGYASRRRAEAQGEIEALLAKYHAYQRAPEITRQRLYLEAMQDLLQSVKDKTIIDADLKQVLPLLNLDSKGETRQMNRRQWIAVLIGLLLVLAVPLGRTVCYTVSERELAVLLQFGQPVASRTEPGLYFKLPFIQEVLRLPKTLQVWHGTRQAEKLVDVPTADGKKVEVTVWAVWRITDPAQFVRTLRTVAERRVAGQGVRPQHGPRHDHHAQPGRDRPQHQPQDDLHPGPSPRDDRRRRGRRPPGQDGPARQGARAGHPRLRRPARGQESVSLGRLKIMDQIKQDAQHALAEDGNKEGQSRGRGIELVDVGLSRIEFVPQVREAAFDRAVSLMEAIATKTTSEGEQRKKEIINKTEAEVQKIEGEGKQEANILKGKADAEIIDSYAKAIRETGEFYNFIRTLEVYKEALKGETRLILTTDSALLQADQEPRAAQAGVQAQPGGLAPLPRNQARPRRRRPRAPAASQSTASLTRSPVAPARLAWACGMDVADESAMEPVITDLARRTSHETLRSLSPWPSS